MKVLLFLLIVLIAVFVFVRTYESQHAAAPQLRPGSSSSAVSLRSVLSCPLGAPSQPAGWTRDCRST